MGKPRDKSKERYWRSLIARQTSSGDSIRRFCCRHGVAEHGFHHWRRIIRSRDGMNGGVAKSVSPESLEGRFIPLFTTPVSGPIEIVHPGGCVIRIPAVFEASTLRQVLGSLDLKE